MKRDYYRSVILRDFVSYYPLNIINVLDINNGQILDHLINYKTVIDVLGCKKEFHRFGDTVNIATKRCFTTFKLSETCVRKLYGRKYDL